MNELLAAFRYTSNNWTQIGGSTLCGCCSCVEIFPADEVTTWTGLDFEHIDDEAAVAQQTAVCPRCGEEAVIGDKSGFPINPHFLGRMNEAWYQQTVIRKSPPKT